MANETMKKFGYPGSLIRDYEHWVVLLRPAQVTLGSLVLAAKSDATAFGQLPPGAHSELAIITRDIEAVLLAEIGYERINYLMLMMVDPHVHFHVFPRYLEARTLEGMTIGDAGWPGPPDLKSAPPLDSEALERLRNRFQQSWLNIN
ncbi:MAG TPA: HIT family protein [Sphingomicrobium sp.]|nr:HIT family protein [Sphingomicrobium sp.]